MSKAEDRMKQAAIRTRSMSSDAPDLSCYVSCNDIDFVVDEIRCLKLDLSEQSQTDD